MTDGQTQLAESIESDSEPTPLLVRFIILEERMRNLTNELGQIEKDKAAIANDLLEEWANSGIQNTKINGFSVHIRNDFYCSKKKGVATGDICNQLKADGFGELVAEGYSSAALKSRVAELTTETINNRRVMLAEDQLSPEMRQLLNYDIVARIVATKA